MENTLTEIAVVLDRSGSMEAARTDTYVPRGTTALLDAIGRTID